MSSSQSMPDEYSLGSAGECTKALLDESDRGCALVAGAWIDERLELLLRRRFTCDSGMNKKLFDWLLSDRPQPPLGSIGVKVGLCQALGIIDAELVAAIKLLARIRNEHFAHFSEPVTFQAKAIVGKVDSLRELVAKFQAFDDMHLVLWKSKTVKPSVPT